MKLRQIEKCITILKSHSYDINNNSKPDVVEVIRLLEIERLLNLGRRKNMLEVMRPSENY